jgi:Kdo2-lipid IVA lauroyltransferase/acyltransferase
VRAVIFYLVLPFIYLLSLLPFPLLYLLSDIFYFFIYHIFGYRKQIVIANLRNSFPGKSDAEIRTITRKFYRYFCDLFLETFKTLTISEKKMLQRCNLDQNAVAIFDRLYAEGKSGIIVMGHWGNWEWAGNAFSLQCKQQLYVIYHPLRSEQFNNLVIKMRRRFGTKLIEMKETFREMVKLRDEINATAFIADQTPAPEAAHWMQFMNQDTPVFKGTGKIAKKLNYPVLYVSVERIKRGSYIVHTEVLIEHPGALTEEEITEIHTKRLEKDIISQPEIWLWSHRRWKHKRPS